MTSLRASTWFLWSVCLSACGGNGLPTALPLNSPLIPTSLSGLSSSNDRTVNWEGTTSDGLGIGFKVSADYILGFYIELPEVQGDPCLFGAGGSEFDGFDNFELVAGPAGPSITDGRFMVVSIAPTDARFGHVANAADAEVSFSLTGHLIGSSGEGTGEFRFSTRNNAPACAAAMRLTWNITRKPEG
jgi:hypothetical protein